MECPICGHPLGENDAFCPNCKNFSLPMQGRVRDLLTVEAPNGTPNEGSTVIAPPPDLSDKEAPQPPKKVAQRLYPPVDDNHEMDSFPLDAAMRSDPPIETETEAAARQSTPRGAKKTRSRKVDRRWKIVTIVACAAALVAVVMMLYIVFNTASMRVQLNKARNESATAQANNEALTAQVQELTESLSSAKEENQALGAQVAELQNQNNSLENNVNQSTYDKDAALNQLEEANSALTDMTQARDNLQAELDDTQSQLESTQAELESAQEENQTLTDENRELSEKVDNYKEKVDFYDNYVVFVVTTNSDRYYHKYDCVNFTKRNFLAYSVRLAESSGYTPCPVCLGGTATTDTTGDNGGNTGFWGTLFN